MKSINKKLYSVIIVCLLILCFSLSALATESSNPSTPSPSSSQTSVTTSTDTQTSVESTSSEGENITSSDTSDIFGEGTESGDLSSTESDLLGSSDLASDELTTSIQSSVQDTSSNKTSSKKPGYYGNVGGYIDDEADTSGWGGGDDFVSSELASAGTTEKKQDKNITNYSGLLWILIWIPVLLILGSVGALVYVNRKAFLEAEDSDSDDANPPQRRQLSAAEKAKRKNNHKNRTNVYKPRDQTKRLILKR